MFKTFFHLKFNLKSLVLAQAIHWTPLDSRAPNHLVWSKNFVVFNSFVFRVDLIDHADHVIWFSNKILGKKPSIEDHIMPYFDQFKIAKFSNRTKMVDFLKKAEPRLDGRPLNELCELLESELLISDLLVHRQT